ncbi:MAG: redox-sensing transcriptional repressor Rex [Clostridia bacterium]
MSKKIVSQAVIKRLPRYYRHLESLEKQGIQKVSSGTLAQLLDITASQVRQDFCNFGGFGQQGYGYDVVTLKEELANIMGLNKTYNMIIIGVGNIGRALANYTGFKKEGFNINAIFDIADINTDGLSVNFYKMSELQNYVKNNAVDIAVISTQGKVAQDVCNEIISYGVKHIWNFAPIDLSVPEDVIIENISMSESLYVLSYKMTNKD